MPLVDLASIERARTRIAPFVRKTPVFEASQFRQAPTEAELIFKLECLQVTGSFKARGAISRLLATPREKLLQGIVTASGGNHGLGVARAAAVAGVPAIVFVPAGVSDDKIRLLQGWGADVRKVGAIFDDTKDAALQFSRSSGLEFFHPFADPDVVAGQGTVALEIIDQVHDFDSIVIAIGGGGLIAGMATALKALKPNVRILGVEPTGSPTLRSCLDAGRVVTLDAVTTTVPTMACARTDDAVFEAVRDKISDIALVEDEDMSEARKWLWSELGVAADMSGAAAVAALRTKKLVFNAGERVCILVCGAGAPG